METAGERSVAIDDDEILIRTLHAEHSRCLLAYAIRLTGDRFAAEDVVQETLLRAWRHAAALREVGSARAWLLAVARNVAIDRLRAKGARLPETPLSAPGGEPTSADHAPDVVENIVMHRALARLTVEHRAVLAQIYYLGRTVAETSRALGIPEGTVKSRTYHALRALRRNMVADEVVKEPTP